MLTPHELRSILERDGAVFAAEHDPTTVRSCSITVNTVLTPNVCVVIGRSAVVRDTLRRNVAVPASVQEETAQLDKELATFAEIARILDY